MALVNVDIDLLRTLIVVAETRNFTTAGERLFRTQSAISLQIKRLEQAVGQVLFERGSGREISLTVYGETVKSYATEILKLNDKLVETISERRQVEVIRIGTPDDYAQLIMPSIIREFTRNDPNVEFQIVSDLSIKLSQLIESDELDLAFMTWTTGVVGIRLVEEPLAWVAAPTCRSTSLDTLPLALFPRGCSVRDSATATLDRQGRRWRMAYSSNQFAPLRAAIAQDEAVGVLPYRAVPSELVRLGPEHGLPELPSAQLVVRVADRAPDAVHRLVNIIARAFQIPTAYATA